MNFSPGTWILKIASTALLTVILLAFAVVVAAASSVEEVRMEDRCDAATFPAEAGCIGHGGVTFGEFAEELNPHDGGHDAWKFNPHDTHIDAGETLRAVNIGGEPHSFTEVFNFGAGIVPPLNDALLPGTAAVPVNPAGVAATFAGPGQSSEISGLSVGVHKFQCLIHVIFWVFMLGPVGVLLYLGVCAYAGQRRVSMQLAEARL